MIGVYPCALLNPEQRTSPKELVGAEIAIRQFTRAMLCYLPPESVGLFVEDSNILTIRQELKRLDQNEPGNSHTAKVWSLREMPAVIKANEFIAFHNPTSPLLHHLAYSRSLFAARPFPITGLIHGFSYQGVLWDYFARQCLTPTLPCDSIICTSRAAQKAFRNILESVSEGLKSAGVSWKQSDIRLDVLPLGVDTTAFSPRDRKVTRHLLGLPQEKTLILHFGRIDHGSKGDLNPLLIAVQELVKQHPNDLMLVIAGNPIKDNANILLETASKVGLADRILVRPQPSLIEGPLYYASADIFVSLSETLQESFGLSPLEAMASGLPVVVTDWSGYRDTVVHGETGFRVTTRWAACNSDISLLSPLYNWREDHLRLSQSVATDVDELIGYLDLLVKNPEKRLTMGHAARQHVVSNYDWQCIMEQYYRLWQELAAIARQCKHTKFDCVQLNRAEYFQNFRHFATECLNGTEILELTDRGRNASRQSDTIFCHAEMQRVLDLKMVLVILKLLRFTRFLQMRVTIQDICDRVAHRHKLSPEETLKHIMWMMKYGLIRIGSTPG